MQSSIRYAPRVPPPPARISPPSSVPPAAARFAEHAYNALASLQARLLPPEAVMMNLINGFGLPRCIWVAAELGIADRLAEMPMYVEDLAGAVGANPDALYRVLRALASAGIFEEVGEGRFAINRLADCLRSDAPLSMRPWARYVGADWYWQAWGSFMTTVKNGKTIHENLHNRRFFQYYADNPGYTETFDAAMSSVSALANPAIVGGYDFSRLGSVVDIGGGEGALLAAILHDNPGVRGTLYDRAEVMSRAQESGPLALPSIADRVTFATGNFFESVPSGHDAYLLKWILHDWDDEEVSAILGNVRRAATRGTRLLVAEMVVSKGNGASAAKLLDLAMLGLTGGRERTEAGYSGLFSDAGFSLLRVFPTASPFSVLEAVAR
jgi:C-methyltransferase